MGVALNKDGNFQLEDTVRTAARSPLILIAASALAAAPAAAQSHVSFSVGVGSLFDGVSFGFRAAEYGPSSVFVGASLGFGRAHRYGSSYGVYSDDYGWRGSRGYGDGYGAYDGYGYGGYASYDCWDAYWDSSWDPWTGWYDGCAAAGPVWYGSYHARTWRRHRLDTFTYWSDPFFAPWGPYWAYDPFDWYWDSYRYGGAWGWGSPYYGVRTVYVSGGRRGTAVYRPSPLWQGGRYGPTYKETARGDVTRTAKRRPTTVAAPSATPAGVPGRTAVRAPSSRGTPSAGTTSRGTPSRGHRRSRRDAARDALPRRDEPVGCARAASFGSAQGPRVDPLLRVARRAGAWERERPRGPPLHGVHTALDARAAVDQRTRAPDAFHGRPPEHAAGAVHLDAEPSGDDVTPVGVPVAGEPLHALAAVRAPRPHVGARAERGEPAPGFAPRAVPRPAVASAGLPPAGFAVGALPPRRLDPRASHGPVLEPAGALVVGEPGLGAAERGRRGELTLPITLSRPGGRPRWGDRRARRRR